MERTLIVQKTASVRTETASVTQASSCQSTVLLVALIVAVPFVAVIIYLFLVP